MKLLAVTCNHCGAPLEAPRNTQCLTCSYCNTRLQVHQTGSTVYTEVLESIAQQTEQIADRVERIELQNRLERLDREWSMRRERYMMRGKHGQLHVPSRAGGVAMAVVGGGFGLFWLATASRIGAPGFFILFGVIFVVAAIVGGCRAFAGAGAYEQRKAAYERERRNVSRELYGMGRDD